MDQGRIAREILLWWGHLSVAAGPWVLPEYEIGQARSLPKQ